MKSTVFVFDRQTFPSNADGTTRVVVSADALRAVIGQAKTIRIEWVGFRMSPNTEVKLKMWESCFTGLRPSEVAASGSPYWTSTAYTSLRPAPETITGPFGANVEFSMEVRATAGGSQVEADGVVCATLILEE